MNEKENISRAEMNASSSGVNIDWDKVIPIDNSEIINVSAFDFSDHDTWLFHLDPSSAKPEHRDLRASTVNYSHQELEDFNKFTKGNRKFIDTRTYTRAKRRSSRPSFENVLSHLTPINSPKNEALPHFSTPLSTDLKEDYAEEESSIPHMLRPNFKTYSMFSCSNNSISQASGPESMEAFLNMSQSKGVDSFINITEPDFNECNLMNVSQPSMLYNSVMSSKDDLSLTMGILTNSMMQSSMFDDMKDVSMPFEAESPNTTVLKANTSEDSLSEKTILENRTLHDSTFENISDISSPSGYFDNTVTLNATFTSEKAENNQTVIPEKLDSLNNTLSKTAINVPNEMNSTIIVNKSKEFYSPRTSSPYEQSTNYVVPSISPEQNFNITFDNFSERKVMDTTQVKDQKSPLNATFDISMQLLNDEDLHQMGSLEEMEVDSPSANAVNTTFDINEEILPAKNIQPVDIKMNVNSPKKFTNLNSTYNNIGSTEFETIQDVETISQITGTLNATFDKVKVVNEMDEASRKKCVLDTTYDKPRSRHKEDNSQIKSSKPISLRQELLKQVRRNDNKQLDSTFNIHPETETFESAKDATFDINSDAQTEHKSSKLMEKNQIDRRLTFTRKNSNTYLQKSDDKKAVNNLNSTFLKPPDRLPQKKKVTKLPAPTSFLKMPQYLQKSNPNLLSGSLNAVNVTDGVKKPGALRFPRGSQPNIAMSLDKHSSMKLNQLKRFKSGSDQRLKDVTYNASDFHLAASCGSTESISSTQSAHSAPDLDDRLSNCSENSSRGSYTINSDQIRRIAQMQEESLGIYESTPKTIRSTNEIAFKNSEDLPSPISKDECEIKKKATSELVTKFHTSSPNDGPSSKNIVNAAGTANKGNVCKTQQPVQNTAVRKLEIPVKPRPSNIAPPAEVKSKLRQPTNFNSTNRPASAASGIPRPMSRIPAPKTTRPKTAQTDSKRGGYI